MKSRLIAISATSSAFVGIILTIGVYFNLADLFCLVVASVFTMLPLYYKSYLASVLSYLSGGIIAFLFTGFNVFIIVIPAYMLFFGIYPIIKNLLEEKKVNKIVRYLVGLVWCVVVFYAMYFFYTQVMQLSINDLFDFIKDNILVFVGVVGVIFFVVYERFLTIFKRIIDEFLRKILK